MKEAFLNTVQENLDPLQFAYRSGRAAEDAVDTLLNLILNHLEGAKAFARLQVIDFSSVL